MRTYVVRLLLITFIFLSLCALGITIWMIASGKGMVVCGGDDHDGTEDNLNPFSKDTPNKRGAITMQRDEPGVGNLQTETTFLSSETSSGSGGTGTAETETKKKRTTTRAQIHQNYVDEAREKSNKANANYALTPQGQIEMNERMKKLELRRRCVTGEGFDFENGKNINFVDDNENVFEITTPDGSFSFTLTKRELDKIRNYYPLMRLGFDYPSVSPDPGTGFLVSGDFKFESEYDKLTFLQRYLGLKWYQDRSFQIGRILTDTDEIEGFHLRDDAVHNLSKRNDLKLVMLLLEKEYLNVALAKVTLEYHATNNTEELREVLERSGGTVNLKETKPITAYKQKESVDLIIWSIVQRESKYVQLFGCLILLRLILLPELNKVWKNTSTTEAASVYPQGSPISPVSPLMMITPQEILTRYLNPKLFTNTSTSNMINNNIKEEINAERVKLNQDNKDRLRPWRAKLKELKKLEYDKSQFPDHTPDIESKLQVEDDDLLKTREHCYKALLVALFGVGRNLFNNFMTISTEDMKLGEEIRNREENILLPAREVVGRVLFKLVREYRNSTSTKGKDKEEEEEVSLDVIDSEVESDDDIWTNKEQSFYDELKDVIMEDEDLREGFEKKSSTNSSKSLGIVEIRSRL